MSISRNRPEREEGYRERHDPAGLGFQPFAEPVEVGPVVGGEQPAAIVPGDHRQSQPAEPGGQGTANRERVEGQVFVDQEHGED